MKWWWLSGEKKYLSPRGGRGSISSSMKAYLISVLRILMEEKEKGE